MQKIGFCERYMLTTAVLNRTKELTRRLEKALQRAVAEYEKQHGEPFEIISQYWDEKREKVCCLTKHGIIHVGTHYKLNEVVAVAQSYEAIRNERYKDYCNDIYNPFGAKEPDLEGEPGWSNKLFVRADLMPHQIQITGVRIERLQAISDDDCLKEGILKNQFGDYWFKGFTPSEGGLLFKTPREAFATLINRPGVGRKGLWESNPFVVVYEFKLIK